MPGHLRAAPWGLLADLHEVHGVLPHAVASLGHRGQPRLLAGHGQGGLRPPGRHPERLVSLWWSPWSPCPHDSGWCLTPITAPESELTVLLARTHSALATLTHSPPLRHQNQFPWSQPPAPCAPSRARCQAVPVHQIPSNPRPRPSPESDEERSKASQADLGAVLMLREETGEVQFEERMSGDFIASPHCHEMPANASTESLVSMSRVTCVMCHD